MAAPHDHLAGEEGTGSAGFTRTSPTPPFLGDDPTTTEGASGHGAPRGPAVASRNRGLAYDDLATVARPGGSPNAVPGLPLIGDDPVEVSGDGAPPPAGSFGGAGLSKHVLRNVARCGFEKPTPLQSYAIPVVMAGRDLFACAEKGTGKAAAFCIPLLSRLAEMGEAGRTDTREASARPHALVLAPTGDRAKQIFKEAKKFNFDTGLKLRFLHSMEKPVHGEEAPWLYQFRHQKGGADVLIGTPSDIVMAVGRSRVYLHAVSYLVIDKADRMIDMGLEPDLRKIVHGMGMPNKRKQTSIFSETFRPDLQSLASDILKNYIMINVKKMETVTCLVRQKIDFIPDEEKRRHLLSLLHDQYVTVNCKLYQPLTLVFVESNRTAVFLRQFLLCKDFLTAVIHGETTLQERENNLQSFRAGLTPILVASDAASRGQDFPKVAHVINYDLPKSIHDYAYRIATGKAATATAFFTESNHSLAKELIELMTEGKQEVPGWLEKYSSDPRVKVDVGCLNEKDELSHRMSQLLLEEEDATAEDDKSEECLLGVEAGLQTLSPPRVSYKNTLENGIKWMSEECFLCFRKYVEQFPIEGSEHKFGQLTEQCFNFDACGKIFHHYNFSIETKNSHCGLWKPQLYFAEVKEQAGVKYYFCCPLEAGDDGRCYGCINQQVDDLKHPSKGGYEAGSTDISWPFMEDIPDSDDDYGSSC